MDARWLIRLTGISPNNNVTSNQTKKDKPCSANVMKSLRPRLSAKLWTPRGGAASDSGVSRAFIVATLNAILNAERRAEAVTRPHSPYVPQMYDGFGKPIKQ
jgi:hypothetical protein